MLSDSRSRRIDSSLASLSASLREGEGEGEGGGGVTVGIGGRGFAAAMVGAESGKSIVV